MSTNHLSSSEDLHVLDESTTGEDVEEYIPCHKLPSPGPSTEHPQDSSKINIDAHAPNSTHGVDTSPQKPLEDQMLERLIRMLEDLRHERQNGDMGSRTLPSRRTQEPFKPTFFGITKQPLAVPQYHQGNEDYEHIFPEDAYGDECGEDARVFKVYDAESKMQDADMIGQSSDSSDVLLVFAGLFSAVLTTFVAQTSQALETDNSAITNSLLLEIVRLQRAQANGTSFGNVERAITETTPSSNDQWVNALWFTSLTLSLATALFAVLTKQWLRQYMSTTSGTLRHRTLVRQFRFIGLQKWHVVGIIGILPIILHLSLCIFLIGLTIFLIPRSLPLAYIISAMTILIYSLYLITNLLPVFDIQCPYRTPFSEILNLSIYQLQVISVLARSFTVHILDIVHACLHSFLPRFPEKTSLASSSSPRFVRLGTQEDQHVHQQSVKSSLSLEAIKWLMFTSSSPSVHSIAIQATGGLPPSQLEIIETHLPSPYWTFIPRLIRECIEVEMDREIYAGISLRPGFASRLERLCRSWSIFHDGIWVDNGVSVDLYNLFRDTRHIEGMVAAVPITYNNLATQMDDFVMAHILPHSSHIKLSPCAWRNLLSQTPRFTSWFSPEFYHAICEEILETRSLNILPGTWASWDDDTTLMTMGEALRRGPELIIRLFAQTHNPFTDSDPPPDSSPLHALLLLLYFLASRPSPDPHTISLLYTTVHRIRWYRKPTKNDHAAVLHLLNFCLVESSFLHGRAWMASSGLTEYCGAILECLRHTIGDAIEKFGGKPPLNTWNCLKEVAEIAFPDGDVSSMSLEIMERVPNDVSKTAQAILEEALKQDLADVYTSFIRVDALGRNQSHIKFVSLVKAFVTGVARQRRSPTSPFLRECIQYLHVPDNLYSVCHVLASTEKDDSPPPTPQECILALARMQPDNPEWDACREKLRELESEGENTGLKIVNKTLDTFFESRRRRKWFFRRLNPLRLSAKRSTESLDLQDIENRIVSSERSGELPIDPRSSHPNLVAMQSDSMEESERRDTEGG